MLGYAENRIITSPPTEQIWVCDRYYNIVTSPVTGRKWTEMNIGANRIAEAREDAQSYGYLFQWGRLLDGHQIPTSNTTTITSSNDDPGHGDFILNGWIDPRDWRVPQNNNLWQNDYVEGWRLPTAQEFLDELTTFPSLNSFGAFSSFLKLPVSRYRSATNGRLQTTVGYFWTKDLNGIYAKIFYISNTEAIINSYIQRCAGAAIRLINSI